MKNKSRLAALMAFAMAMGDERPEREMFLPKDPSYTDDQRKEMKGLKRFDYGDNYLYALNKKNADRKAQKKGWV